MRSLRLVLFGRVQKVGLRNSFYTLVENENIKGYVKNLSDGSVEITIQNTNQPAEYFIELIKTFNSKVHIERWTANYLELPEYKNFSIY